MSLIISIAAFLVAIGTLVTFHELGHYWAARWCNVKVLRFSLGFGQPLWLRRRGPDQTEWVIAAFPLGGYVKMVDERDGSALPEDVHRAFNRQSVAKRMFIVAAGPLANFVLAVFFYWVLFVSGTPGVKPFVTVPPAQTAAARAGFTDFDRITKIGDRPVQTWGDARMALLEEAVKRGTADIEVESIAGKQAVRALDMSSLTKEDLDKDFLGKLGLAPYRPPVSTVIGKVLPGSPAEKAGLKAGDRLVSIDGKRLSRGEEVNPAIAARAAAQVLLVVERTGQDMELTVVPERINDKGRTFGRIGIELVAPQYDADLIAKMSTIVRYGPLDSIGKAMIRVWDMSIFSLKMMGRMIVGDISWKNLSGPITIADYAGQSAQLGWVPFLNFLALISISLGVLNLLPVPVLDGGQLMYHIAELIKGSPVSEKVMEIGQQVGLTLLLGLTAFAFYNDVLRLVSG